MDKVSSNKLRESFLKFFEEKSHKKLESFSLIPENDMSLLFINSGMAPMKDYFTNKFESPSKRVVTCQKCVRTADIDEVGKTSRHGTFFEMLGNFSFGDYFKEEAIFWAFEFLTDVVGLQKERLLISVHEKDYETYKIWTQKIGINPKKIFKFDKENFWEHDFGPCGPCSEIYYDRGQKYACNRIDCTLGCECDRFLEVWNLVFTQFLNDGNYSKLNKKNIDTGMGLERLAIICQGVDNFFLIDTMKKILDYVYFLANTRQNKNKKSDISAKIITDHLRSIVFMIGDSIMFSNEGRGYVLRKLLRRAVHHGKLLGIKGSFLHKVAEVCIEQNKNVYKKLETNKSFIKKIITLEENKFLKTIDQGLVLFNNIVTRNSKKILSGEDAFLLHDTYGFSIDLTKEIAAEKSVTVDMERFSELINQQKERSRMDRKKKFNNIWLKNDFSFDEKIKNKFLGYEKLTTESKVLAIYDNNLDKILKFDKVTEGDLESSKNKKEEFFVVLDKTPFFPESSGQVSDTGEMFSQKTHIKVLNSKNILGTYVEKCILISGELKIGDVLTAKVDVEKRRNVERNHTAAHLLHAALRDVLGNHVKQAGQFVDEKVLRFDVTHNKKLDKNKISKIEKLVNRKIFDAIKLSIEILPISEAKKLPAMALFSKKYKDEVRIVKIGEFSVEFCSGTHVENTSSLGLFKIISESSSASGVRRIEAITGPEVLKLINSCKDTLDKLKEALEAVDVFEAVENLVRSNKKLKSELQKIQKELVFKKINEFLFDAREMSFKEKKIKLVTGFVEETDIKIIRNACEKFGGKFPFSLFVLVCKNEKNIFLVVFVASSVVKLGVHAGNLIKSLLDTVNGSGGGNANIATARIFEFKNLFDNLEDKIVSSTN
ncbi:MAG: alanine--tRNA ligase [Oscillospiraceae bacterium]|jgi:alanyl-tRNA synthetase|nr:alanine--tRNA ligase [Oscillospiraceae bacterium]